jgi:hypothetical protein
MSDPELPVRFNLPVELELALDYLAPHFDGFRAVLVTSSVPALERAARLWLMDEQGAGVPAARLALLATEHQLGPLDAFERVGVVAPGFLAPIFAGLRRRSGPAPAGPDRIRRWLRGSGFSDLSWVGIGSAATFLYAALARAAARGGRPDLVDRVEFAYRRSLGPRPGAGLADLLVIRGRRPA